MRRQLGQLKEQLGWQGVSGLLLLALTGVLHGLVLQPLEREVEFVHGRLDAARSKPSWKSHGFDSGDRQKELEEFFGSLPTDGDVTDILASIASIAQANNVELMQAEYKPEARNNPQIEYGLFFPVQGGYTNIRNFVFRVLAEHPAVALDQILYQREHISDSALKAEIRMTLFIGKIK